MTIPADFLRFELVLYTAWLSIWLRYESDEVLNLEFLTHFSKFKNSIFIVFYFFRHCRKLYHFVLASIFDTDW